MIKKLIVFLASVLVIAIGSINAVKADYGYRVIVSGGLYNDTNFVLENVPYGTRFTPSEYNLGYLEPSDGKYYFKGYHISGQEVEREGASNYVNSITVTKDITLVATYGIKGDTVAYTVRFTDASGRELAPSETYYGNVGDKPVVSYRYIEGYDPQAYNIRGTLKSLEKGNNVFTFIYTARPTQAAAQSQNKGTGTVNRTQNSTSGQTVNSSGTVENAANQSEGPAEILDLDESEVTPAETTAESITPATPSPAAAPAQKKGFNFALPAVFVGGASAIVLVFMLIKAL